MALFSRLFGNRTNLINQVTAMQEGLNNLAAQNATLQQLININFRNQGGYARFDNINQIGFVRDGYNISCAVYSIVSDIAQKVASIPLRVYEIADDKALKSYNKISSHKHTPDSIYLSNQLRTKALREVAPDNPLQRLLDRPNADDIPAVFWQTVTGFKLLCGNSFMYTPALDMGPDKGKVTEMRIMPSPFTALILVQTPLGAKVIGYELIIDGVKLLKTTEVIHLRYPNYDWGIDGQQFYGLPPLKAAFRTLLRSNAAETTQIAQFENGGPEIIVANKSIPPTSLSLDQMSKSKKTNNDEYSGSANRGKVRYMPGDIAAIPLGLSIADLNVIASAENAFDMICNAFHVNSALYNVHASSTYNNIKELKKDNFLSAVVPERQMQADVINLMIVPGYNSAGKKFFVEPDLSGIAELQPDRKETADWLSTSWWIEPNKKLEIQGLQESSDPNMSKIWLPSGYQLMDDASIKVEDLPNDPKPIDEAQ